MNKAEPKSGKAGPSQDKTKYVGISSWRMALIYIAIYLILIGLATYSALHSNGNY
jgi:hypothetical protein